MIKSISQNFGKRKISIAGGNGAARSLNTDSSIPRKDIWSDLAQYRRTQDGLLKRKLTKEEKETFALLPNVELKKMYIQKILTPIRKIKKSVVNRAIAVVITRR